ncbi:F-box protein PP2-B11-like isoform X2 [Sorghum bicolor]|uniref:F-box domain-containing protein n=1 Tax=Sorghum bicolor TaxID=4558 RepID=A0A194YT22_SORBI|nr:F-box protein PP2-B11-like isoform X2 [Sorghum bicolor]KXG31332.1 hypothetical protein SORBI_3004G340566 [Sorghum bicolor]|eukprot:XP_021314341.1 F-box protein PP2-B11-like isoform X2 [Sorghum bicolor]
MGSAAGTCEIARLPEDLLSAALALTTPRDACRAAAVSRAFRDAAGSYAVWTRFVPRDLPPVADGELAGPAPPSKKERFLRLSDCRCPVLLADGLRIQPVPKNPLLAYGLKSMWLDRGSGAKCYMLLERGLHISWGCTPCYWHWMNLPDSRFEVAELMSVCWFEIRGKIHSKMLSRDTAYAAYIVFKIPFGSYGLDYPPQKASIDTVAGKKIIRKVCLKSYEGRHVNRQVTVPLAPEYNKSYRLGHGRNPVLPKERTDGWMELEMGVFYNKEGDDGEVRFSLLQTSGTSKEGLIVQGIEIRPKKLG